MSLPKQSAYLGRSATLALHRDHENRTATLIRDDLEHPFLALFQLEDGFIVTSEECEYELLPVGDAGGAGDLREITSALQPEDVRWVVNSKGELGVEVHGQVLFCYKGRSLSYADDPENDDGSPILYREIGKREFGETVWPLSWHIAGRSEDHYAVETVYTPGLSFGEPDNPAYKWKPLPTSASASGPRSAAGR